MRRFGPVLAAAALALAACGGNSVADGNADLEFVPCSETECSGVLPSGAEFEILLPEEWGGSLALFSHGMRMPVEQLADGGRDDGATESPKPRPNPTADGPEPAPGWGAGDKSLSDVMLQAGYAVAGATPQQDGWSVRSQIVADEELYQYFVENIADPSRVYAWGEATGGLASVRLAELHPEWVSGAAALCAPMSGPVPSFDLALDAGFAVRSLLLPDSKLVGFDNMAEAVSTRDRAVAALKAEAAKGERGRAMAIFLAALVELPLKTRTEPGVTPQGQVDAAVEGLSALLDQSTTQRYLFERLVGGNPSGNAGTDYQARISDAVRTQIDAISPGSVERFYKRLDKGQRILADLDAVRSAAVQGELVGDIKVPVLTLHNAFDPVYIVANESWYRDRVDTFGPEIRSNLVNAYATPSGSYSSSDPAREGAGSCNFEPRTLVGMLIQLDLWVRKGQYPGRDSVAKAFAGQNVTLDLIAPPWPSMAYGPADPALEPDPEEALEPSPLASEPEPSRSSASAGARRPARDGQADRAKARAKARKAGAKAAAGKSGG
jgi:hypothetical protein